MSAAPATAPPPASALTVSVIVTVLNDRRVERTLRSLQAQTLSPLEVIVADGGSKDGTFELCQQMATKDARIRPMRLLGNIPGSRNQALAVVRGDLVAFLDADEVAPPTWLAELVVPFGDPKVGFTGGPTPGMKGTVENLGARYYDAYLRRFYEEVAREHPYALPMGNSAWRRRVFQEVGALDTTLYPRAASEDQDMGQRTLRAGWTGVYVPGAWVDHDFSDISLRSLLRKQSIYATGGFVLWRRSGSTYEATPGRVFPYLLGPFLAVVGVLCLAVFRSSLWVGELLLLAGVVELVGLLAVLAWEGHRGEADYPGWKYRPLEVLRRWATLWGAARGAWKYGWSGRRNLPASSTTSPPRSPSEPGPRNA